MEDLEEKGELDCDAAESILSLGTYSQVSEVTECAGMSFSSLLSNLSNVENVKPLEGSAALPANS